MEHVYYEFPVYAGQIIERVRSRDWFIHSFNIGDKDDVYNPAAYLYNTKFFGKNYTVYLDLNIYQYVISAFKKEKIEELHRDAIALMVFGKFTNITFDPTLAIYEKVNYSSKCSDEITNDLELFRQIDNADMNDMAMFALGGCKADIVLPNSCFVDHENVKLELTKYRRLKKWDSLYLYVLVITKLHQDQGLTNEEKLLAFIRWCHEEFSYSLVAMSFFIALIGRKPKPRLMKYNAKENLIEKEKSLLNMTWDIFLLDKFFECWVGKTSGKEFIYASNDKPLKHVLELAISIQVRESSSHLVDVISDRVICSINGIQSLIENKCHKNRKIFNAPNFQQYRLNLIEQNRKILLT